MTTTVHDPLDYICGDSWEFTGVLQDNAGNPLSLAGASITWRLDSVDGNFNVLSCSLGNGIAIVDAPSATILVSVPASQSLTVSPGTYQDWLRVTLAEGDVFTEWTGVIRVARNPA